MRAELLSGVDTAVAANKLRPAPFRRLPLLAGLVAGVEAFATIWSTKDLICLPRTSSYVSVFGGAELVPVPVPVPVPVTVGRDLTTALSRIALN